MELLLTLIFEFFKTGLFAVGGGLATIPFLNEMVTKYGWFTTETLTTMIAVSESTPGAMGINMATFVGTHMAGISGGIITTLSLVAPSIIVISIIAKMFVKFKNSEVVQGIFYGLRPAVVALIIGACSSIFMVTLLNSDQKLSGFAMLNLKSICLFIVLAVVYKYKKVNPILILLCSGIIGILLQL